MNTDNINIKLVKLYCLLRKNKILIHCQQNMNKYNRCNSCPAGIFFQEPNKKNERALCQILFKNKHGHFSEWERSKNSMSEKAYFKEIKQILQEIEEEFRNG